MPPDNALDAIDNAFGHLPRPLTMVRNPAHCPECAEHEAVMQAVTPHTLTLAEVGSPAWDPVAFLSDEAFCYFMPGLARLALGSGPAYYLGQFLFHLEQGFRIEAFNPAQRRSVGLLLDAIMATLLDEAIVNGNDKELARVMDQLSMAE